MVYTVDMVHNVDMVYTVDMVYIVDMVYTIGGDGWVLQDSTAVSIFAVILVELTNCQVNQ